MKMRSKCNPRLHQALYATRHSCQLPTRHFLAQAAQAAQAGLKNKIYEAFGFDYFSTGIN